MRVGIFGGTFNPVHRGHLLLATGVLRQLPLDRVIWVPARQSPHKEVEGATPAEDRARMVELAIRNEPAFLLSRAELNRSAPSYAIDTVVTLRAVYPPDTQWFFLVGHDDAQQLPTWHRWPELQKLIQFVAVPRPGSTGGEAIPPGVIEVPVQTLPISASEIRGRVREGLSIADLVPAAVERYIEEGGLYQ